MPVRPNSNRVRGECASASRRSATWPRFPTSSSCRDRDANRKRGEMTSMGATKAFLPVTTAEPEATEVGDEHLDAGGDQAVIDAPADGNGIDDEDRTAGAAASDDTKAARGWPRLACILAYGILPAAALLLVAAAGYVKWVDGTARDAEVASAQSVQAAIDST